MPDVSHGAAGLSAAIELREAGLLEEARLMLLVLHSESPADAQISLQCAWTHDVMGLEREALPFYQEAIEQGLEGTDLREALHGLGSTLRAIGEHQRAIEVLARGAREFPESREFGPFLAMAYADAGDCRRAVGMLLQDLAETSADPDIVRYRRALLEYAAAFLAGSDVGTGEQARQADA